MNALSDAERRAGVVAASAGNHAQGVGYHAERLGIPATIYMPANTPFTKVARTEALGAEGDLERRKRRRKSGTCRRNRRQ